MVEYNNMIINVLQIFIAHNPHFIIIILYDHPHSLYSLSTTSVAKYDHAGLLRKFRYHCNTVMPQ